MRLKRGKHVYNMPKGTLDVLQVELLRGKHRFVIHRVACYELFERFDNKPPSGMPTFYCFAPTDKLISFYPVPDAAYKVRVNYSEFHTR